MVSLAANLGSMRTPSPRQTFQWIAMAGIVTLIITIYMQFDLGQSPGRSQWQPDFVNIPSVHQDIDEHYGGDSVLAHSKGRVLITGGGGVIGKHLIARLLSTNTPITVLDKVFYEDEIDALRKSHPRANLRVVHGDIRDPFKLKEVMTSDIIGVINLAAVSRVLWCLENENDCTDVNVRGAEKVVKSMHSGWFIQASSREVYGNVDVMPVPESAAHNAANVYGQSKAEAEDIITKHLNEVAKDGSKKVNAIFLRFSNVYGSAADHRERLIPAIMTNALAQRPIQIVGGDQELDMVYVGDVVNAISLAVNRLNAKSEYGEIETFNVGTSKPTSAIELIRKILWLTNSSSPIQTLPGDARFPDKYVGSTLHAKDVLGFEAQVGIDEGLHRLATAYTTETRDYLRAKQDSLGCHSKKAYSVKDLLSLDGCSGTLAGELNGRPYYAAYEAGKDEKPEKWVWRDDDEPRPWNFTITKHSSDRILIKLTRELSENKTVAFESPPAAGHVLDRHTEFIGQIDPLTGFLALTVSATGEVFRPWDPLPPHGRRDLDTKPRVDFNFRITPFCCPNKEAPWPLFREDPLASNILDLKIDKMRYFNASQMTTLCERLSAAESVAAKRLDRFKKDTVNRPITLQQADMPTGRPADWRLRPLDSCTNLCDHPTICVDTGSCACGQASCVTRPRFPFAAYANLPGLSYPPHSLNWESITAKDPAALVAQVEKASWLNVLRPAARRYLSRKPGYPDLSMAPVPDNIQEEKKNDPDKFQRLQTEWHGCFSADNVMERGAQSTAKEYKGDSLVFLPYYAYNGGQRFPDIAPWVANGLKDLPKSIDVSDVLMPFTFDWGRCNTVLRGLYNVREWSSSTKEIERASVWAPMGDLNSPCYFMDQDVVVPARTCLQDQLRETFGNIASVKPSRQRSTLVTFNGSPNGAGASVRDKVQCQRPYKDIDSKLFGGNLMQRYLGSLKPGANYTETIGDSIFCPLPRGTTGWATRTSDVIYAGCIPVLIGDQTHHPFWDMLDWAKFAVFIPDYDVQNLEAILLSYTWEQVQDMQTNLMLVRDAFLYPSEGGDDSRLTAERGPFYYGIHSANLLKLTKFPV